jgi:carboxypeptidase C (cathepsin A)
MPTYRAIVLTALLAGWGSASALAHAKAAASPAPAPSASPAKFWTTAHTVTTHGSVTVGGRVIHYTAKAGTLILRDKADKPTGEMFYVAYFKNGAKPDHRPLAFVYNGGPGGSSAPLHIGGFGPVRVRTLSHAHTPAAPYQLVNNAYSLLDVSDLVFVDAMGTGFSRIIDKADGGVGTPKMFYGVDADGKTFAQFITDFLSQYGRWNSPKYLLGESYGTTRSAVVAGILANSDNIDLNGVILLSTILNFDTSIDQANLNPGVNLPYALALPSYAAVAWYHKRLAQPPPRLHPWLDQVQAWAMGPYLAALERGAALPRAEARAIATQMAQYTGLSVHYLLKADLRVTGPQFEQELLAEEGKTTGRLDARFSGPTLDPLAEYAEYDPLISGIGSAYVSAANQYLRDTLHFGAGHRYVFLSGSIWNEWKWLHTPPGAGTPAPVTPNVLPDLALAMTLDPDLKVMVNAGYFDLATPYYAAVYQMRQLPMQPQLQKNIEFRFYHTGHMIYVRPQGLAHLHENVAQFIRQTE